MNLAAFTINMIAGIAWLILGCLELRWQKEPTYWVKSFLLAMNVLLVASFYWQRMHP